MLITIQSRGYSIDHLSIKKNVSISSLCFDRNARRISLEARVMKCKLFLFSDWSPQVSAGLIPEVRTRDF